ncbi:hypothetical protein Salat_2933700 [Sesamum alatum]|uniref:Myb/SANT-like domain-containing protein n=1 Tax=Sesamum alatum TaxID=300844 RepID=A0AAE2C8Q7_9LAMI|nr:hypothetical protein Salat_2933700 [Sesamum alatum]
MCALYDVNKHYETKVTYEWAQTRVARLRERYDIFRWVINTEGVIWNHRLGFVTATDEIWRCLCWENKRAKCYINAYDELWDELSRLFDRANYGENDVIDADIFDLNLPPREEGWVDAPPPREIEGPCPQPVVNLFDSSDSSSSMLKWMEDYYGTDSDVDSVLPPPGVPRSRQPKTPSTELSPPSSKSAGPASSTTSNATPIKKED